ncbi:MAG: hypothetical protein QNK40_15630 [Desulfobacterales bacterium]|nr:hypothetical protein [Desulfobacterales bacterium]
MGKKGLVVVIGCGHLTLQIILDRVKKLFDEPIYDIIGGLHLPVKGGRMNLGPLSPESCRLQPDALELPQQKRYF